MLAPINHALSDASCGKYADVRLLPPFSMAFQPIVNITNRTVFAYEALVRGPAGEPAVSVLHSVTSESPRAFRYHLDRALRIRAIELGAALGIPSTGVKLSINFMPGSAYDPEICLRPTIQAAKEYGFPPESLVFEILEDERMDDLPHLRDIVAGYHKQGFQLALDDFGCAYSGLKLLSQIAVDIVKLDAALTHNIHTSPRLRAIVSHTVAMCRSLGTPVIAEAIETRDEYLALRDCGITLMQGYLFARPAFESLPAIAWPT